jgi:hypothetical protein
MNELPPPDPETPPEDDGVYDLPAELEEEPAPRRKRERARAAAPEDDGDGDAGDAPPRLARPAALKIAVGVGAVLIVAIALLWYRNHHRARVVAEGLAEAEQLLRLDTPAAFDEAYRKLEVPSRDEYDPIVARSARAFAAAMRWADYGDAVAADEARALLVEAERAERMPDWARLARAALALGAESKGDATSELSEVGTSNPWADALQARVFMAADQVDAAVEPAAAAAGDGAFVPGLAVEGDVARRARRDAAAARASYEAALAPSRASGTDRYGASPRAVFGIAKLALAGQAPERDAVRGLVALLDQQPPAFAPERNRAALYLAALRLRSGDEGGATGALDRATLPREARAWAERASRVLAAQRGPYRAVAGAPAALRSRIDDDPPVLSAAPPPPPEPVVIPPPPPPRAAKHAAAPSKKATPKKGATAAEATPKKSATAAKATSTRKPAAKKTTTRKITAHR